MSKHFLDLIYLHMQKLPAIIRWTKSSAILLSGFFACHPPDHLHLVAAGTGLSRLCRLAWSMVALYRLASDWDFLIHVFNHRCARRSSHRWLDRSGRDHRRTRDRGLGHTDQSLVLLHQRTASALDDPGLADCHVIH